MQFLLGSRYCETDRLSESAWNLFAQSPTGWGRIQAICDYVHRHITFGYEHARRTRSALEAFHDRTGVCRDYAHLAMAFCRCMNIPPRYCTGCLGDIGVPPDGPMDFSAWFEAFLDGRWYTFDPRNNTPRIGRVLIARGRDASDAAISTTGRTCRHHRATKPIRSWVSAGPCLVARRVTRQLGFRPQVKHRAAAGARDDEAICTAFLSGIVFTMALFIRAMAFPGTHHERQVRLAILLASVLAAASLAGAASQRRPKNDRTAMMTTTAPMM